MYFRVYLWGSNLRFQFVFGTFRLPHENCSFVVLSLSLSLSLAFFSYRFARFFSHIIVKYENIMFENHKPDAEIKVIDFGLSKKFVSGVEDDVMTEGVGTIYTMAPQVLQVSVYIYIYI